MRIRFKLRTLLISTAVIAAVVGIAINLVMNVSLERSALEKLESDWVLMVNNDNPVIRGQSWIEQFSSWADQKLSGVNPRARCHQLELTSKSTNDISTMSQLAKLKYVWRLTLRFERGGFFSSLTAPTIEASDYRYLRKMKKLTELKIDFPIDDSVVQELSSMKLEKLELKGSRWTQDSFDTIGKMQTLRTLHLKADQFSPENVKSISQLTNLEALTLWTNDGYVTERSTGNSTGQKPESSINLHSLSDLPKLKWININGHLENQHFDDLAKLTKLETLGLEFTDIDDDSLDSLMKLEARPDLQFGKLQITLATFDALREAGFNVIHDGLIRELKENYLQYGGVDYPIQSIGNHLSAQIIELDNAVTWRFVARVSLSDNPQWSSSPMFTSPPLQFKGDWRELVGKTATINYRFGQSPEGSFDMGEFVSPEKNRFSFVSRQGNQFRMRGEFHANPPGQGNGKIDMILPFEIVYVETGLKYSAEGAKELLGLHFDVEDFEEPEEMDWFFGQRSTGAKFRLKKSLRTGESSD